MPDKNAANKPVGGLLLKAYNADKLDPIKWVDLKVGDLIVSVASDAVSAALDDAEGVRLPVSYHETIEMCNEEDWVTPTQKIADAMYKAAKVKLVSEPQPPKDMTNAEHTRKLNDGVEKQLGGKAGPNDLVFGAWKLWILHPMLVDGAKKHKEPAVNYGFWKADGKLWQTPGGAHDAGHYDYSQLFQPVKRYAKGAKGEKVDLYDYIQETEKLPQRFLDAYRV